MADQDFNIKVVTTADTSGIQKTASALSDLQRRAAQIGPGAALAERDAAAKAKAALSDAKFPTEEHSEAADRIGHSFERMAIHAVGIGAIYSALNAIKETAASIEKITESLDKQGELLIENSKHMIEQAKFAKDDADVIKIAEEAMKNIAQQHKTVEETQKKELTNWEKIYDAIQDTSAAGQAIGGGRPNQARLELERQQALENEAAARRAGMASVVAAEREKERVANLSSADSIEELNKKIKAQQDLQSKHFQQGDIQGYLETGKAIQQYKGQLDDATKAHQKQQAAVDKTVKESSPSVQAVLRNEAAAREASAAGHQKDAEMFKKSAEAYERGLDPRQKAELEKLRAAQQALAPTGTNIGPPTTVEEFQKQQQKQTEDFYKAQQAAQDAFDKKYRGGIIRPTGQVEGETGPNVPDQALQDFNKVRTEHGGKPLTEAQYQQVKIETALDDILRELQQQTAIWR